MRRILIGAVLAGSLLAVGAAGAGGWATAGLAPPPEGIGPGEKWDATVTVLQHGRTPLEGVQPMVIVKNAKTGEEEAFAAKPTKKPGVYHAEVEFPSGGEWTYAVDDGFGQTHTFAPVQVAGGTAASEFPTGKVVGGGALALALAAGLALFMRRRPAARVATSQ